MTEGTLLYFDARHRVAMIGLSSGDVTVTTFPPSIPDSDIAAILAAYTEPIIIKYGTLVEVPVMSENPASTVFDDDSYEQIPLLKHAIHTPGGRIEFLAGYGPRCRRWFVRRSYP